MAAVAGLASDDHTFKVDFTNTGEKLLPEVELMAVLDAGLPT
jgi:hypothetical protein